MLNLLGSRVRGCNLGILIIFSVFQSQLVFAFARKPLPTSAPPIRPIATVADHGQFELKLMSYNVKALPIPGYGTDRLQDIGSLFKQRRDQKIGSPIIGIQEGFNSNIVELFNLAQFPYRKYGPDPDFPRTGSGIFILSDYQIIDARSHAFAFENSAGWDTNARKGVLFTKIQIPGLPTPIQVFNTHLQADYDENDPLNPIAESKRARLGQIKEVIEFVNRMTDKSLPVFFLGDFNTSATNSDYFDLAAGLLLDDAAEICLIDKPCKSNTNIWEDLKTSVDHQFFRGSAKVKIWPTSYEKQFTEPYNGRMLSDHTALEVNYKLQW